MKRTVALAILGVAAATTAAYGQGGIEIGNYTPPYNVVMWDASVGTVGGQSVAVADGVDLTIWYGEGVLTDPAQLTGHGDPFGLSSFYEGNGYAGYYDWQQVLIPAGDGQGLWAPGETWTFQVRASGDSAYGPVTGASALYTSDAMTDQGLAVPPPPGRLMESVGLDVMIVPEPTSFALAGLGAAALLVFRRRR